MGALEDHLNSPVISRNFRDAIGDSGTTLRALRMNPSATTRELYDRYVIPTYGRFDLRLARGKGCEVWDESGQRYLDFGAGIAVTSIGHCHPRVVAMMQEQIGKLVHTSNLYYTRPQGELAERLVRLACTPSE